MHLPPVLFLHLGAHKTGTTALQSLFLSQTAALARAGVAALPTREFNPRFTRHTPGWRRDPVAAEPEMRAALLSLLPPAPPAQALLISDEGLAGHVRSDLGNAPDRIYQHCNEIPRLLRRVVGGRRMVLILFIRRLDAFLEAAWLQLVRLGELQPFSAYRAGFELDRLSWVPTVKELAETLEGPEDELLVYDHDWLRRDADTLLADLFGRFGAPPPVPGALPSAVNVSFSESALPHVMRFNRIWPRGVLTPLRRGAVGLLQRHLLPGGPRAALFEAPVRAMLARRHDSDLAAIAAMGGRVRLLTGPSAPEAFRPAAFEPAADG